MLAGFVAARVGDTVAAGIVRVLGSPGGVAIVVVVVGRGIPVVRRGIGDVAALGIAAAWSTSASRNASFTAK
jgi:hypothetical protein